VFITSPQELEGLQAAGAAVAACGSMKSCVRPGILPANWMRGCAVMREQGARPHGDGLRFSRNEPDQRE